jgi:ribosomal protein L1
MKDEDIAENILSFYNTILSLLPQEKNNIKNIFLKLTMSKPLLIGDENV